MTSRTRAGKLREIVKEMKVVTAVADHIVAIATKQESKSPAKHKSPAALRLGKRVPNKVRRTR